MHPGPDSLGAHPSFTARRPNASHLPNFELPPPQLSNLPQKYQSFSHAQQHSTTQASQAGSLTSVGNLLTPPTQVPDQGLSPVSSSGVNSSSGGSANSTHGIAPYTPNGYVWSQPSQPGPSPYAYQSGSAGQPFPPRGIFSSSLNTLGRTGNSPSIPDGLPAPPYDVNLPPFPTSGSMSAPSPHPTMAAAQHQQQQQQQQQQHHHHHHHEQQQQQQQQQQAMTMMNAAQTPVSASSAQISPVQAQESFQAHRPPPTPTYYSSQQPSSSNPQQQQQQQNIPYSAGPSPTQQQSPMSAGGLMSRMSPPNSGGSISSMQSAQQQQQPQSPHPYGHHRHSYQGYPLPGPVLSNINNPNGHLALVGGMPPTMISGFNSGHAAGMQHMYGGMGVGVGGQQQQQQHHHHHPTHHQHHHHQQQQPPNDRPFKCDQCPQSFNRNHDLKRHKRIHLAVKPFPCGHCDKSFSRKDALKRHILVKGCGKAQAAANAGDADKQDRSASPLEKGSGVGDAGAAGVVESDNGSAVGKNHRS